MSDAPSARQDQPRSYAPLFRHDALAGRVMLVTGASSGMGRSAAIALSQCGATLVLNGRDADRLKQTRDALAGDRHALIAADLADADAAADLIKAGARDWGPFDGVFHAAGVYAVLPVKVAKQRHLNELFAASIDAAYGIARAAANRNVVRDGGSLVFMSSVSAERGHAGLTGYSASKAAVLGLVRAVAVEFAPRRIRANAIVSGTIVSEMLARNRAVASAVPDQGESRHPLGYGDPIDVANAVVFLMSDAARWITGTSMAVDGGYLAQ